MKTISSLTSDDFISSDVGFIPKSWQCHPLRSLLVESPKYGINAPAVALESEIPVYIRITDISEDGYFRPSEKVGVRSPISHLYRLQEGDIVLARTGASVGKSYLYNADDGELVYAGFLIKVSCDQSLFLPRFLRHFLHTEFFWSWVKVNSMRSGQPGINGNEFARLPIPVPPLSEQTAIANALSDVDALIQELEKLIAKKQAIKTATMQQLLTGRTRLPQFAHHPDGRKKGYKPSELGEIPEDWEVADVGSLSDLLTGYPFPSNKYSATGVRLLRGSNVKRGCTDWSEDITQYWPEKTPAIAQYELKVGDIVISMDGSLVGRSFAQLSEKDLPALLLQRVARLRSSGIEQGFLKEWICSKFFTEHCDSVKTVTAIPHISPLDIRSFKLLLPPTTEEQTIIANILSDMDGELENLDQRLSKTRQIKQGMMQELLTGKTRLL